jgi:hypothetical protein
MSLSSPEMCVSVPRRCVYVRWYRAVAISGHGHLLSVQLAGDVSTTACPRSAGSASAEKLTYSFKLHVRGVHLPACAPTLEV